MFRLRLDLARVHYDPTDLILRKLDELAKAVQAMRSELDSIKNMRGAALSVAAAAKRLGVSRVRTLGPAVARGTVKSFRRGTRRFIPLSEVERLQREWFPTPQRKRTTYRRTSRDYPVNYDCAFRPS